MGLLEDRLGPVFARIRRAPEWLQAGLFGAVTIYAFMLARGGLVVIPIAFLYMAFHNPNNLIPSAALLFIVAPSAGFLGGLAYGIVGLIVGRQGRLKYVLRFIAATLVYFTIIVFLIVPWIEPVEAAKSSTTENWRIAIGLGLLFGVALGIITYKSDPDAA